jgi:1-acyl-sn-glycerol-3-phosphate acyltransferase
MKAVIKALRSGRVVVLFPEGRVTNTGALMKVYDGANWLIKYAKVPIFLFISMVWIGAILVRYQKTNLDFCVLALPFIGYHSSQYKIPFMVMLLHY